MNEHNLLLCAVAKMYFMYTRYLDLTAKHPVGEDPNEDTRLLLTQNRRDELVRKRMFHEKIGSFPKSDKSFDQVRAKFEDMSNSLPDQLMFFFVVKDDHNSPEKRCHTLHKGTWKTYQSMNDAVREVFHVPESEAYVDMHVVHYPNGDACV
jgi:hypothetical protein